MALTEVAWIKENPPPGAVAYWEKEYTAITDVPGNMNIIRSAGYDLVHHFIMPQDAWDEFYSALEGITIQMQKKYKNNKEAKKIIDYAVKEIEAYKKFGKFYSYAFLVMKN